MRSGAFRRFDPALGDLPADVGNSETCVLGGLFDRQVQLLSEAMLYGVAQRLKDGKRLSAGRPLAASSLPAGVCPRRQTSRRSSCSRRLLRPPAASLTRSNS